MEKIIYCKQCKYEYPVELQPEYKNGDECPECGATTEEVCSECLGQGKYIVGDDERKCICKIEQEQELSAEIDQNI